MKKIVSILLAILMVLGVGGCSSMQEETGGRSEHRIGVAVYDVTDDEVTAFREYLTDYIKKCFPEVDFCYSYAIRSAEDEMKFLEDACAEGVEGIMSFITYDLAAEVDYCASKGIYYMLASGTVTDEAYEAVADEPYFLGVVGPGLEMFSQDIPQGKMLKRGQWRNWRVQSMILSFPCFLCTVWWMF